MSKDWLGFGSGNLPDTTLTDADKALLADALGSLEAARASLASAVMAAGVATDHINAVMGGIMAKLDDVGALDPVPAEVTCATVPAEFVPTGPVGELAAQIDGIELNAGSPMAKKAAAFAARLAVMRLRAVAWIFSQPDESFNGPA